MRTLLQPVEWTRRSSFPRPLPEPKVYSPRLRRDQITALFYLKRFEGRPMVQTGHIGDRSDREHRLHLVSVG